MKKYITPEIETLALDTVDVITGSVETFAAEKIAEALGSEDLKGEVAQLSETVEQMSNNTWSW